MKDYKKILEGIVNIINTTEKSDIGFAIICSYIGENCPELKESKDEQMRKGIIRNLEYLMDRAEGFVKDELKERIAWLEKQGEKLPVGFYYVNSEGKKFYSDTFKYGNVILHVEKQGEQKSNPCDGCINRKGCINCENGELREVEQKSADKVEPKIKVKYAGCEYNVLEVKDIAGVTYYGIEDEPNHIDYVKADNCKIISGGYGIKENGSPYPTKTAVFSEQKPAWSEEDEEKFRDG